MASTALYTPEVLGLATSLADYPWDANLPLQATARSKSCGSTLSLAMSIDAEGKIDRIGLKSQACAIGQASAAIFALAARGRTADQILAAGREIEDWLGARAAIPDWPGLETIAAASGYPARHGAILLPWQAARDILSST